MKQLTSILGMIVVLAALAHAQTPPTWTDETGASLTSPVLADLDGDGSPEMLVAAYDSSGGLVFAWHGDGTRVPGFPVTLIGGAVAPVAVGDVLGVHGVPKIAVSTVQRVYLLHPDGSVMPGWPIRRNGSSPPSLADLDGDGDLEVIVPGSGELAAFHHDGSPVAGFPVSAQHELTGVAVGDLDADGDLEIVAGSYMAGSLPSEYVFAWHHDGTPVLGFPVPTPGPVRGTPLLINIDADPMLEIAYGCLAPGLPTMVSVLDHTGATEPGWPFVNPDIPDAMPVAADLDGDGSPEIIIAGQPGGSIDSAIFAFHGDGTPANGFPVTFFSLGGNSACTVADLDGDERFEILLKTTDHIQGVRSDGNPLAGFPLTIDDESLSKPIQPSPAIGDLDGDGFLELFVVANFDNVALYELEGLDSSDLLPWPMSGRNAARDGHSTEPSLTASVHRVSAASGGTVPLTLDAGAANASRLYLLWIGGSGSHPGTRLPGSGGPVFLPVNLDSFSQLALWNLNGPIFAGFGGTLNGQGRATASLNVPAPLPAGLIGTQFRLAFSTAAPWDFVSEAVGVLVLP